MKPDIVFTSDAPLPIGPYSQAIACGEMVFLSGQIALDPRTGKLIDGDIAEQTRQIFRNIRAVCAACSIDVGALVKTTVFLTSMDLFATFNSIYEAELGGWKPARSVVEVSRLPKNALVEIEAIACR